ncbi:hypothetical protein [Brachybacterium sp. ACRRE]|uniref:hypothetical protein n=1 Tax=Brachybacterium sp. ACRRE TaxID=2918184 RepID=UPI001EF29DC4|nr:hypothetical protein [Brachybacterium sp. ACRRE]MCG7308345.1 hypothetical protein [Brachybacterium sp. ACRRE]
MSMPAQPQYPGSPQGAPGAPASYPAPNGKVPGKGMKRAGLIMLIVGLVFLLIGVIALVVSIVKVAGGMSDVADGSTVFSGSTTLQLEAGKDMQAYAPADGTAPSCSVIGEDGTPPKTGTVDTNSTVSAKGESWKSFGSFTATKTQQYKIDCDGSGQVMVAPPLGGGFVGGVVGIVGSIGVGGFGFLLLVVSVILFFVGRSKAKKAQNPAF